MPKSERSSRLQEAGGTRAPRGSEYSYRRSLGFRELLPAIGIGIGVGFFAFYVTRLLLQRTPLTLHRRPRERGAALERSAET